MPKLAAAPEQSQLAPPSPALQSPGPQSAGLALEDYRKFYRGELLAAIGLNDTTVDQRVGTDGVTDAADDVWQALKNLGRNNPGLDGLLGQFQKDVRTDIKAKYNALKDRIGHDALGSEALDIALNDVETLLQSLMLFPEAGLIRSPNPEPGAACSARRWPAPGEQHMLDRLKDIRRAFTRMNLTDVNAWREIEDALLRPRDEELPQILKFRKNDDRRR